MYIFTYYVKIDSYVDPCLRGFIQTIPPVEEWLNYSALDADGGSFVYTEFTCSGTLNSVTIPYMIRQWSKLWMRNLELTLAIWRKNGGGNYVQVGGDIILRKQITTTHSGFTSKLISENVTERTNITIQKNDILVLIGRAYRYYYYDDDNNYRFTFRAHIPALQTSYSIPGSTEIATIPMIHVDFSGQTEEGDTLYTFMCETALINFCPQKYTDSRLDFLQILSSIHTYIMYVYYTYIYNIYNNNIHIAYNFTHIILCLCNKYSCTNNGHYIPSFNKFKVSIVQ